MWLVPWSHTKKRADDYDDMMYMARQATEAIQKVHGSQYELGTSPSLLYATSGIRLIIINVYISTTNGIDEKCEKKKNNQHTQR